MGVYLTLILGEPITQIEYMIYFLGVQENQ